ncbi:mechanosensitive ion channel family protein [Paraglaciecola sp. L1A13]|uniref:mechanosensitive ion channel family protein n=1 Tax=Paraglaciecola sp. L1A13 TaxID=2686359 RepID=UPI00131D80BD|nr:mechanosensitive ion channel family protein [Paraglaciecola sp. L1A13]
MEQSAQLSDYIIQGYELIGLTVSNDGGLFAITAVVLLLCLAWLSFLLARMALTGRLTRVIFHSKNTIDDELHEHGVFRRIAHIVPAMVIYLCSSMLVEDPILFSMLQKIAVIYMLIAAVAASSALLNTVEDVYNASELAKRAPVTGFIQVGKLFIVIVAGLLIISNLLDKSPLLLLSGLGAVTAILLLLFKDTILGFVAGIQIAANRMVNTGDWVELPKYGADGTVLQVGLTTVKVQNWDKTISTVPTYSLITDSMKNWRGMSESAGRRIKRSLYIDVNSIKFCDQDMLNDFCNIRFINEYIENKRAELDAYHKEQKIDIQDLLNSRRLTNIGTLRAYLVSYLHHHPSINQDMTLMVRQLPPTELGLPLEIYCFSANKDWIAYEGIQADIFDHALAMLPVFGLRAYQRISDRPH